MLQLYVALHFFLICRIRCTDQVAGNESYTIIYLRWISSTKLRRNGLRKILYFTWAQDIRCERYFMLRKCRMYFFFNYLSVCYCKLMCEDLMSLLNVTHAFFWSEKSQILKNERKTKVRLFFFTVVGSYGS